MGAPALFDIGWSEMAVILLVALVVIGPRDLPRVARNVGRWVAKGRAMAREFQNALEDMAREAELDKVKSEIEKAGRTNLGKSIENTIDPTGEIGKAFDPAVKSEPDPAKAGPDPAQAGPDEAKSGPGVAGSRPDAGPNRPEKVDDAERAKATPGPAATAEAKPEKKPEKKPAARPRTKSADATSEARTAARRARSPASKPKASAAARGQTKALETKPAQAAPAPRSEAQAPEREAVPADSS